jgi:hypothetical protein
MGALCELGELTKFIHSYGAFLCGSHPYVSSQFFLWDLWQNQVQGQLGRRANSVGMTNSGDLRWILTQLNADPTGMHLNVNSSGMLTESPHLGHSLP